MRPTEIFFLFFRKVSYRQNFQKVNRLDEPSGLVESSVFIISCLSRQLFRANDASPRGKNPANWRPLNLNRVNTASVARRLRYLLIELGWMSHRLV